MHLQLGTGRPKLRDLAGVILSEVRSGQRESLPRLGDLHPGEPTSGHWVGLRTISTDAIHGTASRGGSRGRDFRPLAGREPADWRFRWARLLAAARSQAMLPPIQLVHAAGGYWVVDGHNRVALALEEGQRWIDADVTELTFNASRSAAVAA